MAAATSVPCSTTAGSGKPPTHVLKCPQCDFACLSNNQMCRHIFLTCHTLVACSQCPTRLVCWGFAPGVKKLFEKGRKDNVLLEDVVVETAEKHFEATQHQNTHLYTKEAFFVVGSGEALGLASPKPPDAQDAAVANQVRFRCPDCANLISTWTQMTRHLDATKHSLAKCAECGLALKCYGPAQPARHEKMTGHRGIIGVFRLKADYTTTASAPYGGGSTSGRENYTPQYRCFCGVSFLLALHLADHLETIHREPDFSNIACQECGAEGNTKQMLQHLKDNELHTEYDVPDLNEDDYLVRIPRNQFPFGPAVTAAEPTMPGFNPSSATPPLTSDLNHSPAPTSGSTSSASSSSSYRILYQCPDCYYIFSSWVRIEEHLVKTRHGLAYCMDCHKYLRPRNRGDHTSTTGHRNVCGIHLSRRDYEVLVNLDDADLRSNIDCDEANAESMSDCRLVYQCPVPSCRLLFTTYTRLEDHVLKTRHGCVTCAECLQDVTYLDAYALEQHRHPLSIPPYLDNVRVAEDTQVLISESKLVELFGSEYVQCTRCGRGVHRTSFARHQGSPLCVARAAQLDASGWDVQSQPSSAPGSLHGMLPAAAAPLPPPATSTPPSHSAAANTSLAFRGGSLGSDNASTIATLLPPSAAAPGPGGSSSASSGNAQDTSSHHSHFLGQQLAWSPLNLSAFATGSAATGSVLHPYPQQGSAAPGGGVLLHPAGNQEAPYGTAVQHPLQLTGILPQAFYWGSS